MKLIVGASLMLAGLAGLGVAVLAIGLDLAGSAAWYWAGGSVLAGATGASVVGNH